MQGLRPPHARKMEEEAVELSDFEEEEVDEDESIAPDQQPTTTHVAMQKPKQRRPGTARSCTEPSPTTLLQGFFKEWELQDWSRGSQHRNRSPYSRTHLRSRSTGTALTAPPMLRARSMPNPHMPRPFESSTSPSSGSLSPSPMRSPARARSPFKLDDAGYNPPPRSPSWFEGPSVAGASGIEAIQEDSELDLHAPRAQLPQLATSSSSFSRSNSLRSSRRPASPLHSLSNLPPQQQQLPTNSTFQPSAIDPPPALHLTTHTSGTRSNPSSPSLNPQKYNESYPSLHHYASTSSFSSFSHPSTPTSARSRSPSISSLETIEDAPEFEAAAEAAAVKLAASAADGEGSDGEGEAGRRRSLDAPRRRGVLGGERKRWSICGGERRADLDLETIWED